MFVYFLYLLSELLRTGEHLLTGIQAALHDIAIKQLEMERLAAEAQIQVGETSSSRKKRLENSE